MISTKDEAHRLWSERAAEHKDSWRATSNDPILARLEIAALRRHLGQGQKVLDAGCGNGRVISELLKTHRNHYAGFDYCTEMIDVALASKIPNCRFFVADILQLKEKGFDIAYTVRTIINVLDEQKQERAVERLVDAVKPGGKMLLLEPTLQGLARINDLRALADLEQIQPLWHNLYLNEETVLRPLYDTCDVTVEHFASAYYLTSRLYHAYDCKQRSQQMEYESAMNLLGERLPLFGDFAPHRMFIGVKKR